ncbi:unnamed protein product, partial [Cyprideis torosa]
MDPSCVELLPLLASTQYQELCTTVLTSTNCSEQFKLKAGYTRTADIENGVYSLSVHIDDSVQPVDETAFLDKIQRMLEDASVALFNAVDKKAYFGSVDIFVPASWSTVTDQRLTDDVSADVWVQVFPSPLHGDNPFTERQSLECGKGGARVRLSAGFIDSIGDDGRTAEWGDAGKVFVHEWAHYRYGVFEEYGYASDPRYRYHTFDKDGNIVVTGCGAPLEGHWVKLPDSQPDPSCEVSLWAEPDPQCRFIPAGNGVVANASLMNFHDKADRFCSSERHDPSHPNRQNILCHGRSSFDVVSSHPDLRDLPPGTGDSPPPPLINVVKRRETPGLSLYIVLDRMDYRSTSPYSEVKEELIQLVDSLDVSTKVGVASFLGDSTGSGSFNFTEHQEPLPISEWSLPISETFPVDTVTLSSPINSLLNPGIEFAMDRSPSSSVLLFFTPNIPAVPSQSPPSWMTTDLHKTCRRKRVLPVALVVGRDIEVTLRDPANNEVTEFENQMGQSAEVFIIDPAPAGVWTYDVTTSVAAVVSVHALVPESPLSPEVEVEAWQDPWTKVTTFTASVGTVGDSDALVIEADVTATIMDETASDVLEEVILRDDGQGPDEAANDGIYSGVQMQGVDAKCSVSVTIQSNTNTKVIHPQLRTSASGVLPLDQDSYCCGSLFPEDPSPQPYNFGTLIFPSGGAFQGSTAKPPPNRVLDFTIQSIDVTDPDNFIVGFRWTAPSDAGDEGKEQRGKGGKGAKEAKGQ